MPAGISLATPLAALPAWCVDTETTGLHVVSDAVISIGAVRLDGNQTLADSAIYSLVNPPVKVTPTAQAIHGLSDDDLIEAPTLPELWSSLGDTLMNAIWVGHNIAFDIAHIHYDLGRSKIRWQGPVSLDLILLTAALDPNGAHGLDALARQYGVTIEKRHHALGDAMGTAELYLKLLPLLENTGISSLDDALRFQRRATGYLYEQHAAGWHTT